LIASTWVDAAPAFSPDGERIAFTSDRSGTQQVWICERDGSNATQFTFFSEPGAALGAWSPDGKQIAFNSRVNGNHDIYIVDVNGRTPWQLTPETTEEAAPSWSQDGQWVYFASTRTGRHEVWKIPVVGGPSVQVTKHGGNRPVESPDGKYVFYEKGPAAAGKEFAVWKTPVNGGEETLVADHGGSRWTLFPDGVYLYEREQRGELADRWFLKFYEFAGARKHVLAQLEMPLIGQRPAVSPDRRTILYTQVDLSDADLMLVEDFR
jgi:Tol biopolymer transport system component